MAIPTLRPLERANHPQPSAAASWRTRPTGRGQNTANPPGGERALFRGLQKFGGMPGMIRRSSFAILLALISAGCACGRFGTLAARRTVTTTAEVIDVYGIGALLRPGGVDGGFTFGWRHATYIYPRTATDDSEEGKSWTFGWVPLRRGEPFFLASRSFGAQVAKYPVMLQAHVGYRTDAFTFAARLEESRVVNFSYRAGAPGKTILAMNPLPSFALP